MSRKNVGLEEETHDSLWNLKNEFTKEKGKDPSFNDLVKGMVREVEKKEDKIDTLEERLNEIKREKRKKKERRDEFMLL